MRRPSGWALWLPLALVLAFVALVLAPGGGADSSTLSREGGGWWALWSYAQARGVEVERLDRPLDQVFPETGAVPKFTSAAAGDGVLVLGFPWQVGQRLGESDAVERHLRAGGTVLATYRLDQFSELEAMWRALGIDSQDTLRDAPPIGPMSWWRYRHERWALRPSGELPRGPVLEVPAFFAAPAAPLAARALYSQADPVQADRADADTGGDSVRGRPLVWIHPWAKGRVVVGPSDLLSNAELRRAANADFVETLFAHLDGPWFFDEFHHGMVDPAMLAEADGGQAYSWDLFLLHLALVYLLGAWTLARGFGAAWSDPPAHHGSAAAFLRSLGALHQRLGHHRDAAVKLLERHRIYSGQRAADRDGGEAVEDLRRQAESVSGAEDLLRFACRLASHTD